MRDLLALVGCCFAAGLTAQATSDSVVVYGMNRHSETRYRLNPVDLLRGQPMYRTPRTAANAYFLDRIDSTIARRDTLKPVERPGCIDWRLMCIIFKVGATDTIGFGSAHGGDPDRMSIDARCYEADIGLLESILAILPKEQREALMDPPTVQSKSGRKKKR